MAGMDNAEIVRTAIEAWNAGDRERMLEWLDPEVEIRTLRAQLEGEPYRGHEGFHKGIADFDEDWEYVRFALGEIRQHGDFVVSMLNVQSRGRVSGIELDVPLAWVWEFREGRIVRLDSFSDADDAFRAAGLEG
jgi:ketosteroid isomerase-like protein